ncbi:ComF family protein, partial [Micromonospora sp. R77]|uniref:phosphoribosyltransferase family protein n=1 Tax=Micromonospora sp. R77 TaxID=2925836 RepID=UPI0024172101
PPGPDTVVVLLDDIVTTGVTLAAMSRVLHAAGMPPFGAAVLAATQKRRHW